MQFQKQELLKNLPDHGWEVIEIDAQPDGPRFYASGSDEVITIESAWSPNGFRVYICFAIDPQCDYRKRRKSEDVWAISVLAANNENNKSNWSESEYYEFSIAKGHWFESLRDLLTALEKLRQTAMSETIS